MAGTHLLLLGCSCCWLLWAAALHIGGTDKCYHDYEELTQFMHHIHEQNRDITNLYHIGESVEGRKLWVLELTRNLNATKLCVPNVKLIGSIHGNEPIGKEVLILMITDMIDEYRIGDTQVVRLLDTTRIHILPSLNPDGFERMKDRTCICTPYGDSGRNNANNVDLNGNYPGVFQENDQEEQPETRAVKRWLAEKRFVLSANLQAGHSPFVYYPYDSVPDPEAWGIIVERGNVARSFQESRFGGLRKTNESGESRTDNDELFKHLAKSYATNNIEMKESDKYHGRGYINGAAWQPFLGSMMDYNYKYHGCMEINVELSKCKFSFYEEIEIIWKKNKKSLLNFIGEAQRGVRGVVKDKDTGLGIPGANVTVDTSKIPFYTTSRGEYWKLIFDKRKHHLRVVAEGYHGIFVPVTVSDGPVRLDIELEKIEAMTAKTVWTRKRKRTTTTMSTTTMSQAEPLDEARSEPVISSGSRAGPLVLLVSILLAGASG